jgi:hypothetical protein
VLQEPHGVHAGPEPPQPGTLDARQFPYPLNTGAVQSTQFPDPGGHS